MNRESCMPSAISVANALQTTAKEMFASFKG